MVNIDRGAHPFRYMHRCALVDYFFVHQEVVQVARDVDSTAPLHESNFIGILTVRYPEYKCETIRKTTAVTTMVA